MKITLLVTLLLTLMASCAGPLTVQKTQKSFYIRFENLMDVPEPYDIPYGVKFGDVEYRKPLAYGAHSDVYLVTSGYNTVRFLNSKGNWGRDSTVHNSHETDGGFFVIELYGNPDDCTFKVVLEDW